MKLRGLKKAGFHFRRQAPVGSYIVDFVCFHDRLVIEVDGGQHAMPEGQKRDRARDVFLSAENFRVFRFWNSDIDSNIDGVMEVILSMLRTPTPALRADPPHKGEG